MRKGLAATGFNRRSIGRSAHVFATVTLRSAARDDYMLAMAEIAKLRTLLGGVCVKRPRGERALRRSGNRPFNELAVAEPVEIVVRDSQMTLTALKVEIQLARVSVGMTLGQWPMPCGLRYVLSGAVQVG